MKCAGCPRELTKDELNGVTIGGEVFESHYCDDCKAKKKRESEQYDLEAREKKKGKKQAE
jgi:hypothetical protein